MVPICVVIAISALTSATPSASENPKVCNTLAGDYQYLGIRKLDGHEEEISFLHQLRRPHRPGVRWIRIVQEPQDNVLAISFLGQDGIAIGSIVNVTLSCIDGLWEEHEKLESYADSTTVTGVGIWRYQRGADASLQIAYIGRSTSRYWPGIRRPEKLVHSISYFATAAGQEEAAARATRFTE
jgi:hypothetical protein